MFLFSFSHLVCQSYGWPKFPSTTLPAWLLDRLEILFLRNNCGLASSQKTMAVKVQNVKIAGSDLFDVTDVKDWSILFQKCVVQKLTSWWRYNRPMWEGCYLFLDLFGMCLQDFTHIAGCVHDLSCFWPWPLYGCLQLYLLLVQFFVCALHRHIR